MRQRDRRRLDVIRQVETEVSAAKSAPGFRGEVGDDLYGEVIASYVKRMDKARTEYRELGERGREMAEKLDFEVEFLSRWLPDLLDEAGTRELVGRTIEELGASDPGDVGRVVGHLMREQGDRLDGALVHRLVREELEGG